MTTHIVLWNFIDTLSAEEKKQAGQKIKQLLEPLQDQIDGIISLKVVINELASSNRDIALIGEYESVAALQHYKEHPLHVAAGKYVRAVTCSRSCMDF